jgi:hypothetical protein
MSKGFVADMALILVILIGLSMTVLIAYTMNVEVSDAMNASGAIEEVHLNKSVYAIQDTLGVYDSLFIVIFVSFLLLTIGGVWYIKTNPLFFVVGIVGLVLLTFVGGIMSNVYESFAADSTMVAAANAYPYMSFSMLNLPPLMVVFGGIVVVVLFAKVVNP